MVLSALGVCVCVCVCHTMDNCFYIFVIVVLSPLSLHIDAHLAVCYEKWKEVQV